MSRIIDEKEALRQIELHSNSDGILDTSLAYVALKNCSTIDAVEVRHAEWQLIHRDKNFIKDIYQCSECRFLVTGTQEIAYDYCPYCGARMDRKEQDHENR